jgi:hypothetical protein
VYWLEDSKAHHILESKDFNTWSAARQSLPTGKEALLTLKAELWSAVVKNSKHQDAWTWGENLPNYVQLVYLFIISRDERIFGLSDI